MSSSYEMRRGCRIAIIASIFYIISSSCSFAETDLTGTWSCDDQGTYYLRQIENNLWWYGEVSQTPGLWTNVAYGTISEDRIALFWSDVPKGNLRNNGILLLKIESNDLLKAQTKTGSFGGSTWTRLKNVNPPASSTGQQLQGPTVQNQPPSGQTQVTGPGPKPPQGQTSNTSTGNLPQNTGQSTTSTGQTTPPLEMQDPDFQWLGIDADVVGRYTEAKPDGCPDAHFNLTISLPKNTEIRSIDIRTNKCTGYKEDDYGGLEWSSSYGGDTPLLAVLNQGKILNPKPIGTLGNFSGEVKFDLYSRVNGGDPFCLSEAEMRDDNSYCWMFRPDRRMTAIVHLGNGTDLKKSLSVSGAYAPKITDFRFISQDADKVARMDYDKNTPNGIMDGHFVLGLQLYKAPSPIDLKLSLIDVPDREYGNGGTFSTSMYASDWQILGVVHNGVMLNKKHVANPNLLGNFSGNESFDLYVDPGGDFDSPSKKGYAFAPGAKAVIEVWFCDGTKLKRTIQI